MPDISSHIVRTATEFNAPLNRNSHETIRIREDGLEELTNSIQVDMNPEVRVRMKETMNTSMMMLGAMALLWAGCATPKFTFNASRANTYLASHQDRPEHVRTALAVGRLAKDMNEEEVEMCWGKPDKVITQDVSGRQRTAWAYFEQQVVAYSGPRSVWSNVLVKEVQFTGGLVSAWRETSSTP